MFEATDTHAHIDITHAGQLTSAFRKIVIVPFDFNGIMITFQKAKVDSPLYTRTPGLSAPARDRAHEFYKTAGIAAALRTHTHTHTHTYTHTPRTSVYSLTGGGAGLSSSPSAIHLGPSSVMSRSHTSGVSSVSGV